MEPLCWSVILVTLQLSFSVNRGRKAYCSHTIAQEIYDKLGPDDEMPSIPEYYHHSLTQFIGQPSAFEPDVHNYDIYQGDRILICTDGITDLIEPEEMQNMALGTDDPENFVENLIRTASSVEVMTTLLR